MNNIKDLIDLKRVDTLLEGFNKSTGFVTAILDLNGNVLSKSGWRSICTEFHRINPETSQRCIISDTELANKMGKDEKYHAYRCLNGLMDVAVPLKINGEHVANLFSGQFIFEEPDVAFFKKQAKTFGFDEKKYLDALSKVPVVKEEKVKAAMDFLLNMTEFISEMAIQKLEQAELNREQKASEARYKAIFESTGTATLIVDEDTTILLANEECYEMFGYNPAQLTGQKWTQFVASESLQEMIKNHKLRRKNPELAPRKYEVKLLNNIDEKRDVVLSVNMIPGTKQSVVSMLDITERKQAEEILKATNQQLEANNKQLGAAEQQLKAINRQLTESEAKFKSYIQNAPDGIFIANEKGKYIEVNKAACEITGYSEEELLNLTIPELIQEDYTEKAVNHFQTVVTEGFANGELGFVTKSGEKRFWSVDAVKLSETRFLGFAKDTTLSKHAENARRISEERFRVAQEISPDGFTILHPLRNNNGEVVDFKWVYENQAIAQINGTDPDKVKGKRLLELFPAHKGTPLFEAYIYTASTGKQQIIEEVYVGEIVSVPTFLRLVIVSMGNDIAILAQDITKRKQSEEEFLKAKSNLEEYFENDISADYVTSLSGEIFSCNKTFLSLFGFENKSKAEKFDITNLYKNPEDRKRLIRLIKKYGSVENHEIELVSIEGRTIYVLINALGIFNEDGKLDKIRGYIVDITKQKNVEEELVKFKLCIERSSEAIFITDIDGHIIFVNPAFESLYGYTTNECVGKTPRILKSGTYNEEVYKDFWSKLLARKSVSGELINKTKNDSLITVDVYNTSILDSRGNIYGFIGIHRDISEQKRIEKELRNSEEKYRLLFANNPQPMWIYDLETFAFLEVNKAAINHYGFSKEEFLSMKLTDIRPVDDIPALMEDIKKTHSDLNTAGEWRHKKKNGEIIDVEIISHLLQFNERKARHVLIQDITERKYFEKELLKLSRAVEQSPTSIIITDLSGNIEYVNPKILEITGYSKNELIGKNTRIFKSGKQNKKFYKHLWSKLKSGKEWSGEFLNKKKNGELYWESAYISPIINDKKEIINYVAIKEDITERKKLRKIQEILINIADAIVTSPNLQIFFNIIFKELTKVINTQNIYIAEYNEQKQFFSTVFMFDELDESFSEFPGAKTLSGIVISKKKSQIIDKKLLNELIEKGEIELFGPPSEVWIGVPILNSGKAIGVMAIQNYAGEKNLTEEDMRLLEYAAPTISLAIERKKTFEDLKVAKEKAEESDRLKSAFLANMSHEIRTPMNGILGFTSLLLNPELSSEEKESYIEIVHQSGQRMLNTVTDIVEISKIEAGIVTLSFKDIDINKNIEELVNFFKPEAEKKRLNFILEQQLPEEKKFILTDESKFDSILTNLIKNAIKYTESGVIKIGCKPKGSFIEIYVNDTGIGIPEDRIEAIFNRFEQADIADTRVYEGSGLGLAISKSYVEMLGGKIWVESKEGKGSTFHFTLQAKNNSERKLIKDTQKSSENKKPIFKKLKILIVEDDVKSRNYINLIVKDFSVEILEAATGIEAVEICRNNKDIDLVLMDIKIPVMSGYEATRQIREFDKDMIIIAQTAYALSGDREKALDAGCNDYISKPIKIEELHKLIYKYFG